MVGLSGAVVLYLQLHDAGQFQMKDVIWVSYASMCATVLASFFTQVIEEQHRLYQTKDIFAMDIYPRLSRMWLDFGIFSVSTPAGRSKLRDELVTFVTNEYSSIQQSDTAAGRFTVAKLVTGRPKYSWSGR